MKFRYFLAAAVGVLMIALMGTVGCCAQTDGQDAGAVLYPALPTVNITCDKKMIVLGTKQYEDIKFEIKGVGYTESELYSGNAKIRVRGNSTAGLDKKPFKLKLETKTDLLGMGKSKHWVLLANAIDMTNLRNKTMQTLAGNLGMDYQQSRLVNLCYNGEYMGIYELSEQVRIGKTRVDIYDWSDLADEVAKSLADEYLAEGYLTGENYEEIRDSIARELSRDYAWVSAEDHTYYCTTFKYKLDNRLVPCEVDLSEYINFDEIPKATGGALLEMDFYGNAKADLKTAYLQPIYMSSPDYTSEHFTELEKYLKEYVQVMEYALHSTDFTFRNGDVHYATSEIGRFDWKKLKWTGAKYKTANFSAPAYEGKHYSELLDLDSAISNFIVCEVAANWDAMKNSFFMYKDLDGKMVFGPVWDFDWAFGNSMYGIDSAGKVGHGDDRNFKYAKQWQTTNNWFTNEQYYQTQQFNRQLIRDPYFVVRLYEKYSSVKDEYIDTIYDTYKETIEAYRYDMKKNSDKWRGKVGAVLAGDNLEASEKYTLQFISQRIEWLDEQFSSIEKLIDSLGYYKASNRFSVTELDTDSEPGVTVLKMHIKNTKAKSLSFQVNGRFFYTEPVTDGDCTVKIHDEAVAADAGHLCVVVVRSVNENGKYIENSAGTEQGVYSNAESTYLTFEKAVDASLYAETASSSANGESDDTEGFGKTDGVVAPNRGDGEENGNAEEADRTKLSFVDYLFVGIPCILVIVIVGGTMLLSGRKKQGKKGKGREDKTEISKDNQNEERQD